VTLALAGALAASLAVASALLAPHLALPRTLVEHHPDARALATAGWRGSLPAWEAVRIAAILVGFAGGLLCGVPHLGALVGALVPSFVVAARAQAAVARVRSGTIRLLRSAEATLRAGASVHDSLRRACDGVDDVLARRPFAGALRAFDLGAPLDGALNDAASSAADPPVRLALETLAIGVSSRLPAVGAASLVGSVADRLAFAERLDEEVRARTSGLRAQVLVLALLVPAMALYLALTVPSLASTLGTPLGRIVLVPAAALLEIAGIIASHRVVARART
jgi:Flp pilus assembly protein TadB